MGCTQSSTAPKSPIAGTRTNNDDGPVGLGCTQSSTAPKSPIAGTRTNNNDGPVGSLKLEAPTTSVSPGVSTGGTGNDAVPNVVVRTAPSPQPSVNGGNDGHSSGPPLDEEVKATTTTPLSNSTAEGPDIVGSECVPPPGGREGGIMKIGSPPANLLEIPGDSVGSGRIKREVVTLEGGTTYEGTWKVRHEDLYTCLYILWSGCHKAQIPIWALIEFIESSIT